VLKGFWETLAGLGEGLYGFTRGSSKTFSKKKPFRDPLTGFYVPKVCRGGISTGWVKKEKRELWPFSEKTFNGQKIESKVIKIRNRGFQFAGMRGTGNLVKFRDGKGENFFLFFFNTRTSLFFPFYFLATASPTEVNW